MDYSKVYKSVEKSVVQILQFDSNCNINDFGSGVIIDDGHKILTCAHCINQKLYNGILDPSNNSNLLYGKIAFIDTNIDIAIIDMGRKIGPPLTVKSSSVLEIGNEVFVVGFPYAINSAKTLVTGHVAAFENGLIKIDTSVNNGNSGGPLFNLNGEILGIVNAKLGSLSDFLKSVKNVKPQAFMTIGGLDPVQVIQQMLHEMQRNLNLGIGFAIPTNNIAFSSSLIASIMLP